MGQTSRCVRSSERIEEWEEAVQDYRWQALPEAPQGGDQGENHRYCKTVSVKERVEEMEKE